jgi:hypothetical protein
MGGLEFAGHCVRQYYAWMDSKKKKKKKRKEIFYDIIVSVNK